MNEKFVIVHRTYDPIQADMLADILRENGVTARVLGTRHGAVIGVAQHILQLHLEVPASQAGQATDFLESYFEGEGFEFPAELVDGEDEDEDEDEEGADEDSRARPEPGARRPLLAAGSVLLIFGGSHLYAQRGWTAAVMAVGQAVAFINMMSMRWHTVAIGIAMFGTLILLDLVGGQLAARAYNRGARPSPVRQLLTGAAFVAVAGVVSNYVGPRLPEPKRADAASQHVAPPFIAQPLAAD
jgi:hypothetical protein